MSSGWTIVGCLSSVADPSLAPIALKSRDLRCLQPKRGRPPRPEHDDRGRKEGARLVGSERVAPQPAIHRNDGAADVVRERRGEKDRQHGEVFGLAISAGRDLGCGMTLAELLGIVAADLL